MFFHLPVRFASRPFVIRLISLLMIASFGLAACQPVQAGLPATLQPTATLDAAQSLSLQSTSATEAARKTAAGKTAAEKTVTIAPTAGGTVAATLTQPSATPSPEPTAPQASALLIGEEVPSGLRDALHLPDGLEQTTDASQANLTFGALSGAQPGAPNSTVNWVYALVAPFPTVSDEITLETLKSAWLGQGQDLPFQSLLVEPATRAVLEKRWGAAGGLVKPVNAKKILERAWAEKTTWAIVPFEQLEPRWKVIAIAGQSPLHKTFDPAAYALTVPFGLSGDAQALERLALAAPLAASNRQAEHLTTVMVTGVTALVRGTASLMERRGLDYPATDTGDWLREADILHISNEVPFAENCPPPYDWKDLVFCSRPKYIKLLEDVGADVIELTGDHFADWGSEAMLFTLEQYKKEGWKYYGGGANLEEARQPALFEHNGNKIAFIGCNAKEPGYATASATTPGAGHCNFDRLVTDIKKLRKQGYLPIVTFQHLEYYQYIALPYLQVDFQRVADAGGVIISGSQAHQPHAFEFRPGSFLHYGLGNLFFDQTNQGAPPRTAFIDRHIFYGGRHISTELLTIYFVDYARARPMTLPERQTLLETVFKASGW